MIKTNEIMFSLRKMSNNKFDIEVIDCDSGYFINPLNKKWLSQKIYISLKRGHYINPLIIKEIIYRVNLKSLPFNKEVCYYEKK